MVLSIARGVFLNTVICFFFVVVVVFFLFVVPNNFFGRVKLIIVYNTQEFATQAYFVALFVH